MNTDQHTDTFAQSTHEIKKYLRKTVSFWYLFVISLIITFTYANLTNRYVMPNYSSNTTVIIKNEATPEQFVGGLQLFRNGNNIENEMGFLKSLYLTRKVLSELNFEVSYYKTESFTYDKELYKNSPFLVFFDTTHAQTKNTRINLSFIDSATVKISIHQKPEQSRIVKTNEWFISDALKIKIVPDTSFFTNQSIGVSYYFIIHDFNSLVSTYSSALKVDLSSRGGSILWLWMLGTVPGKMNDFLNKITDNYIKLGLEEKNRIASNTIKFIDEQLTTISDSLTMAESTLENFEKNNPVGLSKQGTLIYTTLQTIETDLKMNQVKMNYYNYLKKELDINSDINAIVNPTIMGITDPILAGYLNTLNTKISERTIMNFSIRENADLKQVELNNYEINMAKNQLIKYINNNIKALTDTEKEINQRYLEIKNQVTNLPGTERQRLSITRKFDMNNEIYNFLQKRRAEAAITLASNTADVKVLDPATMENIQYKMPLGKVSPAKALLLGLIVPVIIIVLIELLNTKITDISDIENSVNAPVAGAININTRDSEIPSVNFPNSSIAESFRSLRTNIQYLMAGSKSNVITITSTISGEGKTFNAVNIASIFALANKKVLLVGLDLRKPRLHLVYNTLNNIGISTYLIGQNTVEETFNEIIPDKLYVALAGPIPPNPSELINSEKMSQYFNTVTKMFDLIIVDSAPIGIVSDALLLTQFSELFLFVVRQNYSHKTTLKLLKELIGSKKIAQISIIINGVKPNANYRYKYGYGLSGHNEHGYYDDELHESKFKKILKIFSQSKSLFKSKQNETKKI